MFLLDLKRLEGGDGGRVEGDWTAAEKRTKAN